MLYKKIRILKGKYGDGFMKTTFLDGAYTQVELSLPFKEGTVAMLLNGVEEIAALENGKLKRRFPFYENEPKVCVKAESGAIYGEVDEETLRLLTPITEEDETKKAEIEETAAEEDTIDENIMETDENTIHSFETTSDKSRDVAEEFGVSEFAPEIEEKDDEDFLRDFNEKYERSPHEETLESLAPDSKWISSDDGVTAVGILYNSTGATHICYAEKGIKDDPPSYNAEWLEGYWIVYNEIA